MSFAGTLVTSRLEVRLPYELECTRFVNFCRKEGFMVFCGEALTEEAAYAHVDHMLAVCKVIPFAKPTIVDQQVTRENRP